MPGNHDQWPGRPVIFGRGTEIERGLRPSPFLKRFRLPNGKALRFIGIDTDTDVRSIGQNRLRARGAFSSELVRAADRFGAPAGDDIGVLLLHHAPSFRGRTLEMLDGSRDDLKVFVV